MRRPRVGLELIEFYYLLELDIGLVGRLLRCFELELGLVRESIQVIVAVIVLGALQQ